MNRELVIIPRYVDDALRTNYLNFSFVTNLGMLKDILSPRDLAFYILINEPHYFKRFIERLVHVKQATYSFDNLASLYEAPPSFTYPQFVGVDNDLRTVIESTRIEMSIMSVEEILAYLGINPNRELEFASYYLGIEVLYIDQERLLFRPQYTENVNDYWNINKLTIKSLMSNVPLHELASWEVFKTWEVNFHGEFV